ncbi:glycosyltransferase family 4 protein [Streptomyces sp. 142MFCol3.1]|uniref:glycosyltransferase family 4 protein n=1 Tax=Streptomyces sp. 142MFCol3.1 TaxID=1172179 RepID=UPI0004030138|nr:glycosyltransferase family 4 protein [Streptomyces sp. 142MFCol3.1]
MLTSAGGRRRVVVVQPYVPSYRTSFFDHLHAQLADEGVALEVLHGAAPPQQADRKDAASCACAIQVPTRRLPVPGGRSLLWRRVHRRAALADLVVLEQALHNLEAYPLLLRQLTRRRLGGGPAVAFWGHGRTYTKAPSRAEAAVKGALTRAGSWFFAYTDGGAAHVAAQGFARERITVVRNSVDTTELTAARARAMTPGTAEYAESVLLRRRHGLIPGRTALFVGGLDAPKRIPFLLACADRIAAELPGFRLLVAGDGGERHLVEKAASRPGSAVVAIGRTDARQTAGLGAVSDVMLMPGRVGLCAVDSFALLTPLVTTDWPWHAPEFEYLADGRNAVITADDPACYAGAVSALLRDPARMDALRRACGQDALRYTTQRMATRFRDGLLEAMTQERRNPYAGTRSRPSRQERQGRSAPTVPSGERSPDPAGHPSVRDLPGDPPGQRRGDRLGPAR